MALPLPQLQLDPTATPLYIDRTALEWFWTCPRKFYWGRRHASPKATGIMGTIKQPGTMSGVNILPVLGLEPLANEHRVFGKVMHAMVEEACTPLVGLDNGAAITLPSPSALGAKVISSIQLDLAQFGPQAHKEYLGLALGLAHQLVVHTLPALLNDHSIMAVEQELLIPLPPVEVKVHTATGYKPIHVQLIIRVKPDLILQHKADNQYVYFEWKTTSFTGSEQLSAFETNPQIQLGLLATALKYGHADWAQVGLFYKGQKRMGVRTSPFCYGYVCADGRLSTKYVKGWHKTPVVDLLQQHEQDMSWWTQQMDDEQEQGQFWMTPPLLPNDTQWSVFIDQLVSLVPTLIHADRGAYTQSLNACNGAFGKSCDYFSACYQGAEDAQYQPREPHHEPHPVTLYDGKGAPLYAAV